MYYMHNDGDPRYFAAYISCGAAAVIDAAGDVPVLTLSDDGRTVQITGDFSGLYGRVALVIDNNGQSGLYVTQVAINPDGTIVIPVFMVPGLTVTGVNAALVPTIGDITSPTPNVIASAFRRL